MASKKTQLAAVISIAGSLDSSVQKAFSCAVKETTKMGAALTALKAKEKLAFGFQDQERAAKNADKRAEKLLAKLQKAKAAAAKSTATKTEQREVERLTKEFNQATAAANKEIDSLKKLERGLKQVGLDSEHVAQEQEKLGSAIVRSESKLASREKWTERGKWVLGFATATVTAASAITGAMFAIDASMGNTAKGVKTQARLSGLTTDYVQGLRMLGARVGMEGDQTDAALKLMFKKLDEASRDPKRNKKTVSALAQLGVTPEMIRAKGMKNAVDVMLEAAKNYKKGDVGVLFAEMGGRGIGKLAALTGGVEGLNKAIEQGKKSGFIMSDDTLDKAKTFETSLISLKETMAGLKNTFGAETLKPFANAMDAITKVISDNQKSIHDFADSIGRALNAWVDSGDARIQMESFGNSLWEVAKAAGWAVRNLQSLGTLLGGQTPAEVNEFVAKAQANTQNYLAAKRAGKSKEWADKRADDWVTDITKVNTASPAQKSTNQTNTFNINLHAAPGQSNDSFFQDFKTRMQREMPSLAAGALTD